jgi:hypothetical protein
MTTKFWWYVYYETKWHLWFAGQVRKPSNRHDICSQKRGSSIHDGTVIEINTLSYIQLSSCLTPFHLKTKTKLHGLSQRANYTNRVNAACRRSDCQLVRIEGATWLAWRIPPVVFSRFSRQEPLLFYQVAPQLYSQGWVDPVPDPLLFFFSGSAVNWTRASGSVAKNSDH